MAQPFNVQANGQTVGTPEVSVDSAGNLTMQGNATVGGTLLMAPQKSAPGQTAGELTLYTTDGNTLSGIGQNGLPMTVAATVDGVTDWVNVKSYGAKGDNTTDDTAAIQAALTFVTPNGGVVYFPAGTYKISAALAVGPYTTLIGDGQGDSAINQTSTTANAITVTDAVAVNIRELLIEGPSSGSGIGVSFVLSARSSTYQIEIANTLVRNFGSHGIAAATPIVSDLVRVVSQRNGGDGFHITGGGTSVSFTACYSNANTGVGYSLNQLNYSTLASCACDTPTGVGYLLATCNNVVILGSGCEVPTTHAFEVTGGVGNGLVSCYVRGTAAIAAWFTGSTTASYIEGFREVGPAGGATASIQVDSGAQVNVGNYTVVTATTLTQGTSAQFNGQTILVPGNGGTSLLAANRGATTNFASLAYQTAGVTEWNLQLRSDSTNDLHLRDAANNIDSLVVEQHAAASNVQIGATKAFGGGIGVVGITNAGTLPSSTPSGGGVAYVDSGMLGWMDSNGLAVPVVAPTNPEDQALAGWSLDPLAASANLAPSAAGVLQLVRVKVRKSAASATRTVWVDNTVAGSVLTNSFVGVYNSSGTLLGTASADQSSNWVTTPAGVQNLSVGTFALAPGYYYVGLLVGSATTLPQFRGGSGTAGTGNFGPQTAPFRVSLSGSALTALPGSVTLGSVTSGNFAFLAGLS